MKRVTKRAFAVGCATVVAVAGAGAAWAYWQVGGSGQATASSAGMQPLTTVAVMAAGRELYPGATGDLLINVSNPNPYPVVIEHVFKAGGITADSAHAATCPPTTLVEVVGSPLSGSWPVGPGGTTQITLAGAIRLKPSAGDGCAGARFSVPVTLHGRSAT